MEQKNWAVVRRLVGYDRYTSKAALEHLNRVESLVRLYVNFFQPVMKLQHKTYATATTPYQRLLESGVVPPAKRGNWQPPIVA